LDLNEQKRAEQDWGKLRQLEAASPHINRVNTPGELASSITHELKQPITVTMANASAGILWPKRERSDIEEALQAAQGVAKNMARARGIIDRLRALYTKTPPKRERFGINENIGEMVISCGAKLVAMLCRSTRNLLSIFPKQCASRAAATGLDEPQPRAALGHLPQLSVPWIAILTGWSTAEVGYQPWTTYGVLRTADAVTPFLTTTAAMTSLILFIAVYAFTRSRPQ
jgi:hypothetical protein